MRTIQVSLAIAVLMAFSASASAQGMGRGPVASACAAEISQYCAHVSHGAGKVRACLQSKTSELSPACRAALDNPAYGRRWR